MGSSPPPIHGRDGATDHIQRLVASPGFRAVVIEGDPGIGKSAVFDSVVASASAEGWQVLVTRPTEVEMDLPYVGLGDLLDGCGHAIDQLPDPLRTALDAALLRIRAGGGIERHSVGRATAAVLDGLAATGRLLVAVDDVQWLDPPTAAALSFALRRHHAPTSAALFTRRRGVNHSRFEPAELEHETLTLGPLDHDPLDHLVRDRVGITLSRSRLTELHRLSQGNPLHAIEIARAAASSSTEDHAPLSVPGVLAAAIEQRLRELGEAGLEATLVVALAGDIDERTVRAVLTDPRGLDAALRHGALEVTARERIRCSHPMFASVVAGLVPPWEIRRLHGSLAELVTDADARIRHRALGAGDPDEGLASELDAAAVRQADRAAPESAALLARAAARLSTDAAAARRRRFAEAGYLLAAGDAPRAQAMLEALVDDVDDPHERARVLLLLADTVSDDMPRSIDLAHRALAEAAGDPTLSAECHGLLEVLTWLDGDMSASAEHCRLAVESAEAAGDEPLVAASLAELCHLQVLLDCRYDEAMMDRALEIEHRVALPVTTSPTFVNGVLATFVDDPATGRPLLGASLKRAEALGDESVRAAVLFRLAELDLRTGRWGDALREVRSFLDVAMRAQTAHEQAVAMSAVALVTAHVGLVDEARSTGEAALDLSTRIGDRMSEVRSRAALGFLDLSLGDVRAARGRLEPAQEVLDGMALAELSIHHVSVNLLEARILDGDLGGAARLVERIREAGAAAGRSWHRVVAQRGDALLAAARGDLVAAFDAAKRAVEAAAALPQPFERARTLLVLGDVSRRANRRVDARSTLSAALEQFDELGAPLWADRTAAHLSRIAGRAPTARRGLTPMEQAVADLAAEGRTNREIAAELFIAVRTVESNLTRVYAKLGVRSRAELVARLRGG